MRKIIILVISMGYLCAAGALCAAESDTASPANSLFAYDSNDPPEVFFFPADKARWDGSKVTLREWYTLTDLQKQRFISEYLAEVGSSQGISTDNVPLFDYLKALNLFSFYSNDNCVNVPSSKVIDKLLSGQGRFGQRGVN